MTLVEKTFNRSLEHGQGVVEEELDQEKAVELLDKAREEFKALGPGLPRHKTLLAKTCFSGTPTALAVYRAALTMLDNEEALALTGRFITASLKKTMDDTPRILRFLLKKEFSMKMMGLSLRRDNLADDPEGWIYKLVPREPGCHMAFDVTRCGVHKYLSACGAPELTGRAICPLDHVIAEYLADGTALKRTKLISNGDEVCSFRYMKN